MDLSNEIVIHQKIGEEEFLQFKKLLKYSDVVTHAYSLGIKKDYRTYNSDMEKSFEENINNYKKLCNVNKLNYQTIIKARQAHTNNVICVKNVKDYKNELNNNIIDTSTPIDSLITSQKDIILATVNADCILMLFYDPVKQVIANTHSGWKGTLQEISVKTVKKMIEEYECDVKDIIVCICPSIRKCHFDVDSDVYEMFYNKFKSLPNIEQIIVKNGSKWNIDTVLINKTILKQNGIIEENIEDCGICSVCNKDYIHSFRAEGANYGLETAIISLKNKEN